MRNKYDQTIEKWSGRTVGKFRMVADIRLFSEA
jgi:hypothetical protein